MTELDLALLSGNPSLITSDFEGIRKTRVSHADGTHAMRLVVSFDAIHLAIQEESSKQTNLLAEGDQQYQKHGSGNPQNPESLISKAQHN